MAQLLQERQLSTRGKHLKENQKGSDDVNSATSVVLVKQDFGLLRCLGWFLIGLQHTTESGETVSSTLVQPLNHRFHIHRKQAILLMTSMPCKLCIYWTGLEFQMSSTTSSLRYAQVNSIIMYLNFNIILGNDIEKLLNTPLSHTDLSQSAVHPCGEGSVKAA